MLRRRLLGGLAILLIGVFAACAPADSSDEPLPTLVNLTLYPTHQFLTQQAPPPGFGVLTTLSAIDNTLRAQSGWTYTVHGTFEGTFDASGDPAAATLTLTVQGDELSQRRRVVLEAEGRAFLPDEGLLTLEGVRVSNDYYIVDVNGTCTVDQGGQMVGAELADLGAGDIIGGVQQAVPTGYQRTIEDLRAWQYTFSPDTMRLPAIHRQADSTIQVQADLWFAPGVNAALVYDVTAQVTGVYVLWANRSQSTVSGTLYLRYELDIPALGVQPNISVPHGC